MLTRRWLLRLLTWLLFCAANGAFASAREVKPDFYHSRKDPLVYTAVLPAQTKLEHWQLETPPILETANPICFPRVTQPILEISSPKSNEPTDLPRARAPPA